MSDIEESTLIELRLVIAGTPGLLAAKVEHIRHREVVRVTDERGPWVDLDDHVFLSGERHHWETYVQAKLGELADRLVA